MYFHIKKPYLSAAVMLALGIGVFAVSEQYVPQQSWQPAAPEETEAVPACAAEPASPGDTMPATVSDAAPAEAAAVPYRPSIYKLNLAYAYPEDTPEGSDMTKSYGGLIFEELTGRDEDWLGNIYSYADFSPVQMAKKLGQPLDDVTGGYNPRDSRHDPDDPSTWTINEFKNVQTIVTDGDGMPINMYSNVVEIMSMANAYTFYKGIDDHELFRTYAAQLWEASHSHTVSMGDIYYCSGCLGDEAERREREELEREAIREEQGLSGEELADEEVPAQEPIAEDSGSNQSQESSSAGAEQYIADSEVAETGSAVIVSSYSRNREKAAETSVQSDETESAPQPTSAVIVSQRGAHGEAAATPETSPAAVGQDESAAGEEMTAADGQAEALAVLSDASAENGTEDEADIPSDDEEASPSDARREKKRNCPGHIDLIIRVQIRGLNEENGLFSVDRIGRQAEDTENEAEDGWQGWTDYNVAAARALSRKDWFQTYGLSLSVVNILNPLENAEIEDYMSQLPEDLSPVRRRLVHFALSSVGKVPYYWGGKASAPYYQGNDFGTFVKADHKGRVLKGLDCSGWVGWVYWSVTGKRLAHESTSGLALLGKRINRFDLLPGDIIVRTGSDAHVVMFLGWTEDGRILCVHESSAGVNNVTVAVRDANWTYYRRLID